MKAIHNKFRPLLTFKPLLVVLSLALLAGCARQAIIDPRDAEDGLLPRQTGLDRVSAAYAFDLSGARVYLEPVTIAYSKRYPPINSTLRSKDYELRDKDMVRMREVMGQAFSDRFLAPRQSELVADKAEADYILQLDLSRFALSAPIDPVTRIGRVYADQSAYGILSGELQDSKGNAVMRFSDRRDIGDNFGNLGSRGPYKRFTSVTFWGDMRTDLRRAFASLDQSLQ